MKPTDTPPPSDDIRTMSQEEFHALLDSDSARIPQIVRDACQSEWDEMIGLITTFMIVKDAKAPRIAAKMLAGVIGAIGDVYIKAFPMMKHIDPVAAGMCRKLLESAMDRAETGKVHIVHHDGNPPTLTGRN